LSRAGVATAAQSRRSPLPRGPHALPSVEVAQNQRERIFAALPLVVEEHGYQGTSVARIVAIAGVSSRAFYDQFSGKRECFALVHEAAQERLLAVLSAPCEPGVGLAQRVRRSLGAGLDLLAAEPALARLIALEAPAAGGEIAARHYYWLGRYADLLDAAAVASLPEARRPSRSTELTIVGGIAFRAAQKVLSREAERLPQLGPELIEVVLSFYGIGPGRGEGAGG
jgi:AcrR family transcriptional regulator